MKNSGGTALASYSYSYSPAGTILTETDTPASSQTPASYTYDAKGRVTSMTPGTGATLSYGFDASSNLTVLPAGAAGSYDKAGELTSSVLSGTTTSYAYNAGGQRLTATQGGTTVSSGTWNGAGQLTAYSGPAGTMTGSTYDGAGRRAAATVTPAGGSATTQGFVWDGNSLLMDSANAYIYGSTTAPAEQVNLATGTITYLAQDALGSVRAAVSTSGTITGNANYDAWGNPLSGSNLATVTPFGYAGSYTDPTGLDYLLNRYYDPATGQFASLDPAVSSTLAPYGYAGGDSVDNTDPTGLCPDPSVCGGVP